jgi:hypothetical protein
VRQGGGKNLLKHVNVPKLPHIMVSTDDMGLFIHFFPTVGKKT